MSHPSQQEQQPPPRRTSEVQSSGFVRGAKLLKLPIGHVGRNAVGLGKRLLGGNADEISHDLKRHSAEQLFAVLGDLKGGAMKAGQVMSLLEAALDEDKAAPYREELRRLQTSASPMPSSQVSATLRTELGSDWQKNFTDFDFRPRAAASIGQVHHAVWAQTGQEVAVKVQYPGADEALRSDLRVISRLSLLLQPFAQGMDMRSIAAELTERISQETDYLQEAANQQQAAQAFSADPEVMVPPVLVSTSKVLVSRWIEGTPLSEVANWDEQARNAIGLRYVRFLFRGPHIAGLLHADPHPGNFIVQSDGRIAAIDWGLAASMPTGLPAQMGRLLRLAQHRNAADMADGLCREGFVTKNVDADQLLDYLLPFVQPAEQETFHFNREWMREQYRRIARASNQEILANLNLPADYLMLHRVWLGGVAVLSQLDCTAAFSGVLSDFLPGWH